MKVIKNPAHEARREAMRQREIFKHKPLISAPVPSQLSKPKESMSTAEIDAPAQTARTPDTYGELRIKRVADRLKVGVRELAAIGGIGASTLHQIITLDQWPKRTLVRRAAIEKALHEAGATDEEVKTMWQRVDPEPKKVAPTKATKTKTEPETEIPMLMGKQTLSMEARKQFGLFANPFDGEVSSDAEMFQSGEIRFIREACWQTAINGSFVAVLGESGAGKTTILADLKDRVQGSSRPVIMIEPSVLGMGNNDRVAKTIKSADILAAGISTLAPLNSVKLTIEARTRQFIKLLETSVSAGNNHMLVIEEAHDLPVVTLQHLKRLHERARIGRRSALGILLIGHPELRTKLMEVREVHQRCEILELEPLDHQLRAYLEHKAKIAGKELGELVTDDGIEAIRARLTIERRINNSQSVRVISLVYPLAVHNMITAALNTAAAIGAPIVDADVVREL